MSGKNQLPVGWEHCQLGEIVSVIRGVSYSKDQSTSSPKPDFVPILRATNINRSLDFEELVYVEPQCVSSEQFLRNGDIVIAASSGSKAVVGKAAHFEGAWIGSFGAFCMGLRPCKLVESRYVGYFLQSDEYRHRVSDLSAGSNINNLKRDHIQSFPFRIAPISEQRRIVAKIEELFSGLDAGVAALKRAKANLKRYRAAVLKAAVEGKLTEEWRAKHPAKEPASALLARILKERREKWEADQLAKFAAAEKEPPKNWRDKYVEPSPPDTSNLPELPDGWCWASVDQICDVGTGTTPSRANAGFYENGTIPWIMSSAVNHPFVDEASEFVTELALQETTLRLYPKGTLILALYGEGKTRGLVSELRIEATVNQALGTLTFSDSSISIQPFVKVFLTSNYVQLRRQAAGGMQPNLNLGIVKQIAIPIPPLYEQTQIVIDVATKVSQIDDAEATIEQDLLRASRLRQSILKRAFEGKLVPQDPKDEPASVLLERLRASRADQDGSGKRPRSATPHRSKSRGNNS